MEKRRIDIDGTLHPYLSLIVWATLAGGIAGNDDANRTLRAPACRSACRPWGISLDDRTTLARSDGEGIRRLYRAAGAGLIGDGHSGFDGVTEPCAQSRCTGCQRSREKPCVSLTLDVAHVK